MAVLGDTVTLCHSYVLARLRMADRALLPREIAPSATITGRQECLRILRQLEAQGRVSMNPQTDRWSIVN